MKKTKKKMKLAADADNMGTQSELCPCGCGYGKGNCVKKMQKPKSAIEDIPHGIVLTAQGEPLHM